MTLIEGSARAVKGRQARDIDELGERIFGRFGADLIAPEIRELVHTHQRRGHTVVLTSSALASQVTPVARYLGIEDIVCNRLVTDEQGMLTGTIEQPAMWGPAKANAVREFAAGHQVDLAASYCYAGGDENLDLMHLVGHPQPTNPDRLMIKEAVQRGWPIMTFGNGGSGGPIELGRRIASVRSLGPQGVAALAAGLVRGTLPGRVSTISP